MATVVHRGARRFLPGDFAPERLLCCLLRCMGRFGQAHGQPTQALDEVRKAIAPAVRDKPYVGRAVPCTPPSSKALGPNSTLLAAFVTSSI